MDANLPAGKPTVDGRMPRHARFAVLAFLMLVVVSLAAGYAVYHWLVKDLERSAAAALTRVAAIEGAHVSSWIRERKADAAVFGSAGMLIDQSAQPGAENGNGERLRQQLKTIRDGYNYLEVAIHDAYGDVLVSTEEGIPGSDTVTTATVQRALASKATEISTLYFIRRGNETVPVVDIATPVPGPDAQAVLTLRAGLGLDLSPLATAAIALPDSAGAVLVEALRGRVRVAAQSGSATVFNDLDILPLAPQTLAANAASGTPFELVGAGPVRLDAVAHAIPGLPWYILSTSKRSTVVAAAHRLAWQVGLVWLGLLALLGTVLLLWWRRKDAEYRLAALRADSEHRQLRRRYDFLSRYANDMILLVDDAGRTLEANDQACAMFGRDRRELLGVPLEQLLPPDRRTGLTTVLNALHPGRVGNFELCLASDGQQRWFDAGARAIELDGRQIVQIICRDITERRHAEMALRESDEKINSILGSILDIVWSFSPDFRKVNYLNDSVERVFGRPRSDFIARPRLWLELVDEEDRARLEQKLRTLGPEHRVWECEYRIQHVDGGLRWLHCRGQLAFDGQGRPLRFDGVATDISERKQVEQQVQTLAYYDHVTGLPNRQLLNERLGLALAMALRNRRKVALLFMDLDNFKHINDALGHHAGDALLRDIAKRLDRCVRAEDTVARVGGDEFQVMLPDLERGSQAATVAEKILESVAQPIQVDGNEIHTTFSIGISVFPDDARTAIELGKHADSAMYQAKGNGRANYQFFTDELNQQITRAAEIERRLRRALDAGELSLCYQPQIDIRTSRIIGAEALLRWRGADGLYLSPLEFIPIAEERGLINRVGEWALREACLQCRRWQEMGLEPVPVAVNVSPIQFQQKGFAGQVTGILAETRLDATLLELEITESAIMKRAPQVAELAMHLREAGVGISIDDFGTGYSSLSYLKQIPIDKIKIDRSFIADMLTDDDDLAIAGAIVGLARNLRLRVIAEGVESRAQIEQLRGLGCDEVQGHYFSRAVNAEEFGAFLANGRVMNPVALARG